MASTYITYAQEKGLDSIDWNARLAIPENKITRDMWEKWAIQASRWVTCAVGNQCSIIPREVGGEPEDRHLSNLGIRFFQCIQYDNLQEAKETLAKIEERSAYLLNQLRKT